MPAGITTDLDGNPRIINAVVDMGAYEVLATIDVAASCADHDGTEYCLDMAGSSNVECRIGSGDKFIIDFNMSVTSINTSISCVNNTYTGTHTASLDGGDSSLMTVTLSTPLPDQDCCRIDMTGPSRSTQYITMLSGDVNRGGGVTSSDSTAVKQRLGRWAPNCP